MSLRLPKKLDLQRELSYQKMLPCHVVIHASGSPPKKSWFVVYIPADGEPHFVPNHIAPFTKNSRPMHYLFAVVYTNPKIGTTNKPPRWCVCVYPWPWFASNKAVAPHAHPAFRAPSRELNNALNIPLVRLPRPLFPSEVAPGGPP